MKDYKYKFDTQMIHAGYSGDPTNKSIVPPLYLTNAYHFDNAQNAQDLFELKASGNIYTRLSNPTNDVLEQRVATLDGGVAALSFATGHAAIFNTIANLAEEGDEIVASSAIYGGAINMLGITFKRLGINVKFVNPDNLDEWENNVTDKTKAFFFEVVGNPNANVVDIEAIAKIAHSHGIPVVADSTFTTPFLCRPIEFGADFVVHSATKFLGGHSAVMGGIVVDSGNFDFKGNPRFPLYNEPDLSYHGIVFADLTQTAFITRLRVLITRDLGACLSPFNAFLIMMGVETLSLRMQKHCENAEKVVAFLKSNENVSFINYPNLPDSPYKALADKYLPKGVGSIFTFGLKGGKDAGRKFMDSLELLQNVANVGEIRSLVIHPATTTHSQLSPEQLVAAGITEDTVRLSIGLEDSDDIIADLQQAINKSQS